MIEAQNLVKHYGRIEAIRGVSFHVRTGEIVGLLGPNGAGKTTIMKVLTCFHYPTSGTAVVDSHDVTVDPLAVRRSVGYLPENAPLYQDLRVVEYLRFTAEIRGFSRGERETRVERALAGCGLVPVAYRAIGTLSKGYRQRVGLAQAILHDPETLILDEPTNGLDPNQILEIRDLVRELGKRKTVVLSTHVLQEVERMCGTVLILNHGLIAGRGTTSELGALVAERRSVQSITLQGATRSAVESALADLPEDAVPGSVAAYDGDRIRLEVTLTGGLPESVLFDWAVEHRFTIVAMTAKSLDLEEIFHRLTRSEGGDA